MARTGQSSISEEVDSQVFANEVYIMCLETECNKVFYLYEVMMTSGICIIGDN